jgi:hypothetical protein
VGKIKTTRVSPPRSHRDRPAFPHANGFNGFLRALPGESGFLATIIGSDAESIGTNLTSASRCQDHTTSPSAWLISSASPKRPPHPAPTFRDDREAPLLVGRGMARTSKGDLPDGESENVFEMGLDRMGLDRRAADLPVGQITSSFRKPPTGPRDARPDDRLRGYPESICQDDLCEMDSQVRNCAP